MQKSPLEQAEEAGSADFCKRFMCVWAAYMQIRSSSVHNITLYMLSGCPLIRICMGEFNRSTQCGGAYRSPLHHCREAKESLQTFRGDSKALVPVFLHGQQAPAPLHCSYLWSRPVFISSTLVGWVLRLIRLGGSCWRCMALVFPGQACVLWCPLRDGEDLA